ncbi:Protein CBG11811 [Caenorhabditis briggsae]|uniref:Protein kinase domain-containing protein n=2 Tax=Caenorhabditis briggsae TaxID=6238 RepID=A0AAE9CUF2_CAEBR|nr:Protein CBG11811 [Caenorhabditis briggsae]ULT81465.1 hypothetical protein L3Y34_011410 [Caenorhabditis briggsae]CAP30906.2 Protein CBG11811 [Caenorhabditis briggsae]
MSFVIGEVIDGKYHVNARIGKGGFGVIFKVTDYVDLREKALKTIGGSDPKDEDYLNEVHVLTFLAPVPGVQKLQNHFTYRNKLCLVLDLYMVDMVTLAENKLFSQSLTSKVGHKLTEILRDVHNFGIIHRDIKPENLMIALVGEAAEIRLIDFGMACFFRKPHGFIGKVSADDYVYTDPASAALGMAIGKKPSKTDDFVMLVYTLMKLRRLNPFQAETGKQRTDLKQQFHENPARILKRKNRFLLGIAKIICENAVDNVVNYESILYSLKNSAKYNMEKPFKLHVGRRNKMSLRP